MRESVLVRIASDPVVRVWEGARTLPVPADAVDPAGASYLGWGKLINVPAVQQLINGAAERLEFTVTGISAEVLALAAADSVAVREKECRIGTILFDDAWQPTGPISWEWQGTCDSLTTESEASDGTRVRSVTLSVRSPGTDRRRPLLAFFTDQDQRRRSPDDSFCDHVAGITLGTTARFGPK